jgi:hypothetical protein
VVCQKSDLGRQAYFPEEEIVAKRFLECLAAQGWSHRARFIAQLHSSRRRRRREEEQEEEGRRKSRSFST